ncbi:hypothetical protein Rsub_11722 [Raphidocelis subcapitata]|uniref:C3H1-type domain-containing protein n=1 Tax=Raphidocelis subcapitata TaxID=307507 RepID=A0A2V0PM34_9CHLO|nr:hypothetical protein Rsub_11722 [Raphidocelis subcapitata]|eukprot:GBF98930.1 hypothetical protein Rsub_11722 [Raphidocelis subcapitata]
MEGQPAAGPLGAASGNMGGAAAAAAAAPVMSLSDLSGPACGRTTRLDKSDAVTSDFWMYKFKIDMCPRRDPHDWEQCLYAHRGEKARRRHPSKYRPVQCPEARAKTLCPRGDECPCTHNLFEYWLHPDRFRTCICEQGPNCNRPICFFAHAEDERRPLPEGSSDPATLPGAQPSGRGGGGGGNGGYHGGGGGGGRHNRPGATAMVVSASGVAYPSQGLQVAGMQGGGMVLQQGGAGMQHLGWHGAGGAVMLQGPGGGGGGGGGGMAVLSTSPALSATSGVSYGSLSALRSHTPSPGLLPQGSGPLMWGDSGLMAQHGHPGAVLMAGGGAPGGEEGDAILSFSLWDGATGAPTAAGVAAAAAAAAAQQEHNAHAAAAAAAAVQQQQQRQLEVLQAQQQQQQQQQLAQLQQLQQQAAAAAGRASPGNLFSGFESWSPMHSPLASPHGGRSGAGVAQPQPGAGGGRGLVLGHAGAGPSLAIAAPRATASPRQGGAPQDPAAAAVAAVAAAATAGGAAQAPALRAGSSVDALAADLSTLLSASGLRALSAKLAALADEAEGRPAGAAAAGAAAAPPAQQALDAAAAGPGNGAPA